MLKMEWIYCVIMEVIIDRNKIIIIIILVTNYHLRTAPGIHRCTMGTDQKIQVQRKWNQRNGTHVSAYTEYFFSLPFSYEHFHFHSFIIIIPLLVHHFAHSPIYSWPVSLFESFSPIFSVDSGAGWSFKFWSWLEYQPKKKWRQEKVNKWGAKNNNNKPRTIGSRQTKTEKCEKKMAENSR